ncbi:MAG: hypothetical protein Q4C66_14465 [Lachnospiraceae bacterium]|nr:hypothetical protein [Lachnospiraceae bacterium]
MTRKKGKFITFCCSLFPGAGEMYLGFLKQGISIMGLFFLLFSVGGIIFPPSVTFCAVIWFYSFFHTHNLNSLPDDEFYAIEDDFLIHLHQLGTWREILFYRYRRVTAVVLILLGFSIVWSNVNNFFMYFVSDVLHVSGEILEMFSWFSRMLPQTIAAILIMAAGIYLIRSKKQDLEES